MLYAASYAGLNPVALHIDHGIHPHSAEWAQTVFEATQQLGVGFASQRLDHLQAGMPNLENAARNARHLALQTLAQQRGVDCILLAHHANDQAETVLLNLLRGTGLGGVGMPKQRQVAGITWQRPWLDETRSALAAYAAQQQLTWVEDPSNTNLNLRRNAVRHQLWPTVTAVEPRALPSLLRFSSLALEAAQTEQALAVHWVQSYTQGDAAHIDWHGMMQNQTNPVQIALLRAWLSLLGCKPPTHAHATAMLSQLNAKTRQGLRCTHQEWAFGFKGRVLCASRL